MRRKTQFSLNSRNFGVVRLLLCSIFLCFPLGLLVSDDGNETTNGRHDLKDSGLMGKNNTKTWETKSDAADDDSTFSILQCRAVFKCKICPRIVCLSEETLRALLVSKRHARSKKLLSEGRLKLMVNSDGEVEEDPVTHAERHA